MKIYYIVTPYCGCVDYHSYDATWSIAKEACNSPLLNRTQTHEIFHTSTLIHASAYFELQFELTSDQLPVGLIGQMVVRASGIQVLLKFSGFFCN